MATAPALSVIMSVYNGAAHLYPAVRSILDQDFADFEFLIVNDGSTDGSAEILRVSANEDARIKLIDRENKGLVASLNELINVARAPLLARMDCDDIAMPNRFLRQIAYLDQHPAIGILGSNSHDLDEDGVLIGATDNYPLTHRDALTRLADGPPLCHPSVMMRTSVVRDLGGYRAAFRHAEDYDLWLRASRHTDIANLADRLLLYRRSKAQVSQKYAAEQAKAAAIAWHDHQLCLSGSPSLFDNIDSLPGIDELDIVFGQEGISAAVRKRLVERMRYSPEMLHGPEFGMMLEQIRSGGGFEGAGRTILRLGRMGRVARAVSLATVMTGLLLSSS
jgi:glycosyltransferase involved in cell wall biosynthesis